MNVQQAVRRRPVVAILVVAVLGGLAGAAYGLSYLFLRAPAPAAVGASAEPAASASAAAATSSAASASPEAAETEAALGMTTWTLDPSIGSSDDFTGSFVGYRVQEELAGIGGSTAVGRTPDVSGSLIFDGTTLTSVEVNADLTTLVSDDDRRDNQLRRQAIETDAYPTATFTLTEPIPLASYTETDVIEETATGELTLHGVTRTVEVPVTASYTDGVIAVTGSIDIVFADYDIEKPTSFIVLSVDDHGVMEFQLLFTQA